MNMASMDSLSDEDQKFLASCEELLKDRYTESDEEFMKVYNAELSQPPIIESWWVPNNGGRSRNDRRFNRRSTPYSRDGPRGAHGRYGDHAPRGCDDRTYSHRPRNY